MGPSGKVIPIPFIIDTGTPTVMNLGVGALRELFKKGMVQEDATMRLRGNLLWRDNSIHKPIVDSLPHYYEELFTGDVRMNVIRLEGIGRLRITWAWDEIENGTCIFSY